MQKSKPEMSHDDIKELEKNAESGDSKAQTELGIFYCKNEQYESAVKWFKKAEMKDLRASYVYAMLYERGWGVTQNFSEAIARYSRVQEKYPHALLRLGGMYENGMGLEQNLDMARLYYYKAIKKNVAGAADALKKVKDLIEVQKKYVHAHDSDSFLEKNTESITPEMKVQSIETKRSDGMQESNFQQNTEYSTENDVIDKKIATVKDNNENNTECQASEIVAVSDKEDEHCSSTSESKVKLDAAHALESAPVSGGELAVDSSDDAPSPGIYHPNEQPSDETKKSSEAICKEQKSEPSIVSETDSLQEMSCSDPSFQNIENHVSMEGKQENEHVFNQYPVLMEDDKPSCSDIDESKTNTPNIKVYQMEEISSNWECREPSADSLWPKNHQEQKVDRENGLFMARRRGRSHEHDAKYCDDDGDYWHHPSGWTVLVVADGAGSAEYSREGSRLAVSTVIEEMQCWLTPEKIAECDLCLKNWQSSHNSFYQIFYVQFFEICKKAINKIKALAESNNFKERQFATTLLATVSKTVSGTTYVATLWIGDGAIVAYRSGASRLLGLPDSGAFVGQTRFLDANYLQQHYSSSVSIAAIERAESLILMTDGVSDPKFKSDAEIEDVKYWDLLWQEIKPKLESEDPGPALLEWLHFPARGYHDDRTLAISLVKMDKDEN